MKKGMYKFILALMNNKLIFADSLFLVSLDITTNKYIIWYIDSCRIPRIPRIFDCCDSKDAMLFKWKILMNKGVV